MLAFAAEKLKLSLSGCCGMKLDYIQNDFTIMVIN